MPHTRAVGLARASSAANPITVSLTLARGDTVVCLMLNVVGATNRAGGAPTWGAYTFTQANSTQKAAASPEASVEIWYLLNPLPGTFTLTIPNTGAATIKYTVDLGRATLGGTSQFDVAVGANGTSTNPSPGALTTSQNGAIIYAAVASGAQTWAPSAQGGTAIANTDDGSTGGGEQYMLQANKGAATLNWTFATSDDWGAIAVAFKEVMPHSMNNYMGFRVGDGSSVTEKIR